MIDRPELLERSGSFVAHYTSMATAVKHILPKRRLRLGRVKDTNDPREYEERVFSVRVDENSTSEDTWLEHRKIHDAILRDARVFCTTGDACPDVQRNTQRCFGRPRMWAHYGDHHKGICLVFDRDALDLAVRSSLPVGALLGAGEVEYKDLDAMVMHRANSADLRLSIHQTLDVAVRAHLEAQYKNLFFYKNPDWSSESEYRWLAYSPHAADIFAAYGGALAAVVGGVNASLSSRDVLKLKEFAPGVLVTQLVWNGTRCDFDVAAGC